MYETLNKRKTKLLKFHAIKDHSIYIYSIIFKHTSDTVLATFVYMLTSAQESNWREKWFILAHSLGYNPSWRGSQGWRSLEQHGACSEEAERIDGCMCSSSLPFIQSRIPHLSSIHKVDHPTSINVIKITAYKHGQRHIFQVVLDSAKLTRLTITSVRDACIVIYCLETSVCRGTKRVLDVSGEAPPKVSSPSHDYDYYY